MTTIAAQDHSVPTPFDRGPVVVVAAALLLLALAIGFTVDGRQVLLFAIGALLGMTLYHSAFGFTGGWRRLAVKRRGRQFRAQLLAVAVACVAFIPLLAEGAMFDQTLRGAIAPVGVSVLFGAAMFGVGMQLGGGCGSGTLFTVGGGNARMLVTLAFFMVGALAGTAHLPFWLTLPSLPAISVGAELGVIGGIAVTLIALGGLALISVLVERQAHGDLEAAPTADAGAGVLSSNRLFRGPWPLFWAGAGLAALNVATLLTAGHPWSITYGFGLWAAKIAQGFGVPVANWEFWNWPGQAEALRAGVLNDVTSVMNFGLLLGAALAAGLAGRFAPKARIPVASLLAAAIGGVLMGYGARLAFGCNIGALFSGIASGSLHGWLWFGAAFVGSLGGIGLRPLFGLDGYDDK